MKSIRQLIEEQVGPDQISFSDIEVIAERYAVEVLDWVLTTEYEKGDSHKFDGDDDWCWYDEQCGTYRSSTLVEQYNKLSIIEQKK